MWKAILSFAKEPYKRDQIYTEPQRWEREECERQYRRRMVANRFCLPQNSSPQNTLQPIADKVAQHLEIISKNPQFSTRRTRILMGFIMYYSVLIVNRMGRILVRWNFLRNNLEMLCHPICKWLSLQFCACSAFQIRCLPYAYSSHTSVWWVRWVGILCDEYTVGIRVRWVGILYE